MVKPLSFKGDKKSKKRKAPAADDDLQSKLENSVLGLEDPAGLYDDDTWVTAESSLDLGGPIVFVLPSVPPECIACDSNGKVFTSALQNLVDGSAMTAEPHDVRQVWVANRIAGTDNISFKGHHQRYLSCNQFGILSATTEAISPEESFLCIPSEETPGIFHIRNAQEKYLTISDASKGMEVRGDAEDTSLNTTMIIRMQARFKPRLKANKESKVKEKISRKALEDAAGRKLDDDEVKRLKKARVQGDFHEIMLDVKVKGKHDKYS